MFLTLRWASSPRFMWISLFTPSPSTQLQPTTQDLQGTEAPAHFYGFTSFKLSLVRVHMQLNSES
jgi:hypothetical protein